MTTKQTLKSLQSERTDLAARLAALDTAIAALDEFISLNGSAPAKSKVESNGASEKGRGRRVPEKAPCPDCGKKYHKGAGMAAHRKQVHGWRKGMPLDRPVPRSQPLGP